MNAKGAEEFKGLDLWSLIKRYLRYWYIFLGVGILSLGAAWIKLQSLPLIYTISGKVFIDQNDKTSDINPQGLISPLSSRVGNSLYDEIEIIKSRQIMSEVVRKLGLDKTYYVDTRFGLKEVYDQVPFKVLTRGDLRSLYGRKLEIIPTSNEHFDLVINGQDTIQAKFDEDFDYKGAHLLISNNQISKDPLIVRLAWPHDAARSYSSRLSVVRVNRSNVLELSMDDAFSYRAVNVLNEVVEAYNTYVLNKKRRSARTMIEFIDDRLAIISEELFNVEKQVEDYKRNIDVPLDLSRSASDYLTKATAKDQMIVELGLKRDFLDDLKSRLNNDFEALDYLPLNTNFNGEGLDNGLISKFNNLLSQRSRLLVSATNENPSVQIINDELVNTRKNILTWIDIKDDQFSKQQAFYKDQLSPVEERIAEVPKYERELLQIMRQQKIKESLFTYLLQRREETAVTLASEVTSTTTIDSPLVGPLISPNKVRVYAIHLMVGLAIPALIFLIVELFDRTVHSTTELKALTSVPFLGGIAKTKIGDRLISKAAAKSVTAEMMRLVRTNLNFLLKRPNEPNVVLVTSSQSGEGKTFISINIASVIAQSGKSVIAVELDLRKPKLREYLGINEKGLIGVSNFLSGEVTDIGAMTHEVQGHENYYFIPSGPIPPNPSELIMSERMGQLIEMLKQKYDTIIIDTPPIGVVADALLLKEHVNASLYVLRASYSKKADIGILNEARRDKLMNTGVVLNGIKIGRGYGSYRSYGYGYYSETKVGFLGRVRQLFKR